MKRLLFGIIALLITQSIIASDSGLERKPYRLDFGAANAVVKEYFIPINGDEKYSPEKGMGWTKLPEYSFERNDLNKSTLRNKMTRDGLTGKEISFRIDIPKGEWYFTFWMEMGFEDENTAKLSINGDEKQVNLYKFHENAEGRTKIASMYRVYHSRFSTDEDKFEFNLTSVNDSIRILGATFIPVTCKVDEEYSLLHKILGEAGKYRSKVNLYNLKKKLESLQERDIQNSYIAYWAQQVDFLFQAERLIDMMGWEWERYNSAASIFDRLRQAIMLLDANLENIDIEKHLLTERAQYLRGKLSYDLNLEQGGSNAEKIAKSDLWKLWQKYPDDQNLKMFNGELIDLMDYCDNLVYSDNAPKWSKLQREAIWRLSSEIDYWVNVKQAPNGEWGGKIGDDVELLRWWSPFLLTGNKTATKGWKKVADAAWNDPKIYKGYSKRPIDVEHASEFISDSTPELLFVDEDSTYYKRLLYTAEYFENLWTVISPKGDRFLRSAWYSSTEVDERPPRNRDVDYNARAVKPLRYLAWYTRNPGFIKLLDEWSMAWVHAALSTEKNKPEGVLPASMRGQDGAINGDENNWYKANMMWDYFDWKFGVGSKILDNIIFTYTLTGNDSLLLPFELQLELVKKYEKSNVEKSELIEGSEGWAADQIKRTKHFWEIAEKWKRLTNNTKYDDLLLKYGNDYTKYKVSGDIKHIESGLEKLLQEVRYNTPLRTSLVLHTDRVRTPGANHLKAMMVGDGTPEGSSPYYAVTWENTNDDFTAFVKESNEHSILIEVFNHNKDVQNVKARFWQLEKGEFGLSIISDDGSVLRNDDLEVNGPGVCLELKVPSQELITIRVERK